MHRLDVAPEEHFAQTDYGMSEVLIYRWDPNKDQVLVCCLDLSEQIATWAFGAARPDYSSRYRIFCFYGVSGYHRSGTQASLRPIQDDFLTTRDDHHIPLDDISVSVTEDSPTVTISFEQDFGRASFSCQDVAISEVTIHAELRYKGTSRYFVDVGNGIPFDEGKFLSDLYGPGFEGVDKLV